jgi:hypothetical protein
LASTAIAGELNRRKIEAPRGGPWYPMGVARPRQRGYGAQGAASEFSLSRKFWLWETAQLARWWWHRRAKSILLLSAHLKVLTL